MDVGFVFTIFCDVKFVAWCFPFAAVAVDVRIRDTTRYLLSSINTTLGVYPALAETFP